MAGIVTPLVDLEAAPLDVFTLQVNEAPQAAVARRGWRDRLEGRTARAAPRDCRGRG